MTNKIFKSAILDFSVSAQNAKANVPLIRFNTQDSGGTARLVFSVKKEGDSLPFSSAAEITLAMVMSVGEEYESKYVVNPVITNRTKGIFEYSLTDDQISHNGQVNAELYVKYPNQSMQINRFNFEIEKAMIDDNFSPLTTYYVKRWDDYEKIFDESIERLNTKLDDVDKKADDLQQQFDNLDPTKFLPKSGGTMTGALQFDGVPTIFQAKQNNAWWYRLTSENSTTYQQSLFPAIVSGINGVQGAGYNFKQAYLRLNNIDVETVTGSQAKADKALDDAKTSAASLYEPKIAKTAWTAPVLNSGFSILDSRFPPLYRLKGTTLQIKGAVGRTTAKGVMFNLPAGFRTSERRGFSVSLVSSVSGNVGTVYFQTNGDVELVAASQDSPVWVEVSFDID
ncbi:phage baseplate upper protein [Listeria monocytogenes]